MGWVIAGAICPNAGQPSRYVPDVTTPYRYLWDVPVEDAQGVKYKHFEDMATGVKAAIVVNVASNWTITDSNYSELAKLCEKYRSEGFEVFAFPSNEFGNSEPSSALKVATEITDKFGDNFRFM